MIIDTAAAVAMLRDEPESAAFIAAMDAAVSVHMSAASVLELAMVTSASGPEVVDEFLEGIAIQVVPVDAEHLRWARHGQATYGRGSGSPARLNFGDCLSYGDAKALDEPLLFTGDDFIHTDVESAVPRPG